LWYNITNCFYHAGIILLEDVTGGSFTDFIDLELVSEFSEDQNEINAYLEMDNMYNLLKYSVISITIKIYWKSLNFLKSSLTESILSIKKISDYYDQDTFSDEIETKN